MPRLVRPDSTLENVSTIVAQELQRAWGIDASAVTGSRSDFFAQRGKIRLQLENASGIWRNPDQARWHDSGTGGQPEEPMKRLVTIAVVACLTAMTGAPLSATDPESQSASSAASLTALLDQLKLDAVAARDPEGSNRYIAAFYMPGIQLLVVNAPYSVPALLDKKIAAGNYMEAYADLQSVADRKGHFFVIDMQADGLKRDVKADNAFDSTSIEGAVPVAFDGKWDAQKLTEEEYNARFNKDDARYARLLDILGRALARKTTTPF